MGNIGNHKRILLGNESAFETVKVFHLLDGPACLAETPEAAQLRPGPGDRLVLRVQVSGAGREAASAPVADWLQGAGAAPGEVVLLTWASP